MVVSSSAEQVTADLATSLPALGDERVSVVIPCYNEELFIGQALENLAHQYQYD